MNFDFQKCVKNEFCDNYEKSCSLSRNRVSHKIGLKPCGHAMAMPTTWELIYKKTTEFLRVKEFFFFSRQSELTFCKTSGRRRSNGGVARL